MLVSVNVLAPFSYAQVETSELIPGSELETVDESFWESGETPEINEETSEVSEEIPEANSEEKWELEQGSQDDETPEDILPNVQDDVETPAADETENVDTENNEEDQPEEETSENKIQDEEEKIEELEKVEKAVVMDIIPGTIVTLLPWTGFNSVIKTLANGWTYVAYTWVDNNIQKLERVNIEPTWVTTGEISELWSEYPVYAWFSWWVLYYSTKAEIIQLNENSQNMFQNFGALTELDLSNFDTSNVTNIFGIFAWCSNLEEINLNWWDFSNTSVNMMNMTYWWLPLLKKINMQNTKFSWSLASAFAWLSNVEEIDLRWADTSNVTNIGSMFGWCSKLEKLNLEWWILTWNISNMFGWLSTLKEINLDWVNTKWVTNMSSMFWGCSSLIWLDLSSFDTSNVINMWWMLGWSSKLEELNLSWWDFRKSASTPKNLFWEGNWSSCSSSCNLKKLNLTNVKFWQSMNSAFMDFKNLEELKIDWIDTSDVTDMRYMFKYCSSNLTGLDLSNFDTSNVTDMFQIFAWCYDLEMLNLSGWDFHHIPSYGHAYWLIGDFFSSSPSNLKILDMTNAKFPWNMSYAFRDLVWLEELKLDGVVTSWVTNMNSMFYNCKKLTWLNLGSFDTSNVTDMSFMFFNCSSLTWLDLGSFDTSDVTSMWNIFNWCSKLEDLNLSWWDFTKVTDMSRYGPIQSASQAKKLNMENTKFSGSMNGVFSNLANLEEINLSWADVSSVTNMSYVFNWCRNLKEINLQWWDTSNVTTMNSMFYYCDNLKELDLSSFDTSNVTNMGQMFYGCSSLTWLDLSNFDTSNVINMWFGNGWIFWWCNKLEELNLSGWDFKGVSNNQLMVSVMWWTPPQSLKNLNMTNTKYTWNATYAFGWLDKLEKIDLEWVDTRWVTNMSQMFQWCTSLTWLDLSNFDTSNVIDMKFMFQSCSNLENLSLDNWKINNSSSTISQMFLWANNLKAVSMRNWTIPENFTNAIWCRASQLCATWIENIDVSSWNLSGVKNLEWLFWGLKTKEIKWLNTWDTRSVTNMNEMFFDCSNLTWLDLSNWNTSNVTNVSEMFQQCSNLIWLDLSNFDTSNVNDMWGMFWWCSKLEEINLSGWDFRNISNASLMMNITAWWIPSLTKLNMTNTKYTWNATYAFGWLTKLEELNLDWADTSNVTSMNAMFNWDSNLKNLDLSSFDTSNVKDMNKMFYNTPNLKTIYASENFVTTALSWDNSSKDMFSWTTSVVWWNWTKFDPNYIDKEYAKIDKVWQTWYFTDKNAINVKFISTLDWTETTSTFAKWQKLTPPSVNGYHAVWWYLDEAMTQAIDLNKGVNVYSEIYVKYERNGSSGWWGGGWGWSTKPDTPKEEQKPAESPQSDASSWTNVKEPESNTGNKAEIQTWSQQPLRPTDSSFTKEQKDAYTFAKENWITTKDTIQSAQMNGKLTRIAMAKMLSQYAINVLWKTPDTSKTVKFKDVSNKKDADYDNGVTLAYQLGIMWQNMPWNKFRPNDEVSRAEFATALSRLLYQTTDGEYKSTKEYYIPHMAKLYNEWIISNTDPSMSERRWYVMIMLMRSAE